MLYWKKKPLYESFSFGGRCPEGVEGVLQVDARESACIGGACDAGKKTLHACGH